MNDAEIIKVHFIIALLQAMGKHEEAAQLKIVQDELGTNKEELPVKQ